MGFVNQSIEALFELDPAFAVYQGRHDFDGRLPDWSEAGIQRVIDYVRATYSSALGFNGLSADQQFERDYLLHILRGQLFYLEDADWQHTNPSFYINGGLDPNVYLRDYADPPTRMQAMTNFLRAVPAAATNIRANLKMPMPASFISYAASSFAGYSTYYSVNVPNAFAGVGTAAMQQELSAAATAASAAMQDLAAYMNSNAATATQNFALGPDRFLRMLSATEGVNLPISELVSIGQQDLARNQAAVTAACSEYAPGASIAQCIATLNGNQPSDGPVAAATRQIATLRSFVVANDLVTIPGNEQVLVRPSPPYRAGVIYFDAPGPYENGLPSIYYIPANSQISEPDLLFVTVHEAMPGHFVQFLHANRAPSIIGRLFVTSGFAEGWAHYSEEMMLEAGLGGTPATRLGQLLNALLRNCRYLAAIGMHAQGMTQAQVQNLFQQQCYASSGTAAAQANRGTFDPGYLNYTMNKLMIRRLRTDWTASRGDRAAWKAFHDKLLSYGGPPIPLVRSAMMGGPPQAVF